MIGNVFEVNKLEDITQEYGSLAQLGIGAHCSGCAQRGYECNLSNATCRTPVHMITLHIRCATR